MKLWIAIAVLMFASVSEAGSLFPEGTYTKVDNWTYTMHVTSEGDYEVTYINKVSGEIRNSSSGFALNEGSGVCTSGDTEGNLWTVDTGGDGHCYSVNVRGNRLIINQLNGDKPLGGIWTRLSNEQIEKDAAAERARQEELVAEEKARQAAAEDRLAQQRAEERERQKAEEARSAQQLAAFPIKKCPQSSEEMTKALRLSIEEPNRPAYLWLSACPRPKD